MAEAEPKATLLQLGDAALLVKFAESLSDSANRAAIVLARRLELECLEGVVEIVPGLVSVLLRTTPGADPTRLCGELRLMMGGEADPPKPARRTVAIAFDGEDLAEVAELLGVAPDEFISRHNAASLRVLATGFAPGFVYCGFHSPDMVAPRRETLRPMAPAGAVLFAAGQTAIAATPIRTGWHVIGTTTFRNFDPAADPPTTLRAGDEIDFTVVP